MSLPRSLGLFGAMMLVVGNVVGAGIFTTSGFLAAELDHPMAFLSVWVLGGLLTLCGALTYAELGAMFPRAGGDYQFLKEAYGPLPGFLLGWLSFWIISPGSVAALSIAIVAYLPLSTSVPDSIWAAGIIVLLSLVNLRSTRLASSTQTVITVISLLLLSGLVVGGFVAGNGSFSHFEADGQQSFSIPGSAMVAVLFTYSGWFAAAYVGSEVLKPERNVPLALFLGTVIVAVLYVAINAVYLYALPLSELEGKPHVAGEAALGLFGGKVAGAMALAIALCIGSCINASIMTGARICYAMAEDGVFWSRLSAVHSRFQTPFVAILAEGIIAVALVLLGTFEFLLTAVVFAMLLSSIATGCAHIVLRVRKANLNRPYRTIGYPLVPLLFIASYAWIAASVVISKTEASLLGIGMAVSGVPAYFWWKSRKSGELQRS